MNKLDMGYLSVVITLMGYALYIKSMFRRDVLPGRQIKPHPLSWALFGFLTAVGWLVQLRQGGQAGSWCLGVTSSFCFIIALISYVKYQDEWHSKIKQRDWMYVILALCLFVFSFLTNTPLLSATLATLADIAGYGPTIEKGWSKPHEDYPVNYVFNSVKCIPALAALSDYSWATCMYLVMLTFMNMGVAAYLMIRRYYLARRIKVV